MTDDDDSVGPSPTTVVRGEAGHLAAFGLAAAPVRVVVVDGAFLTLAPVTGLGWHGRQLLRAVSRLINAARGGEGDTTYSAGSWARKLAGCRLAAHEVRLVDWLNSEPGHCEAAWHWHRDRGLLADDGPD